MESSISAEYLPKRQVSKIAVTGGPCGGKTSVLNALSEIPELKERYICVPEAATLLLPGFLAVRSEIVPHVRWQTNLQRSITATQLNLEAAYEEYADAHGIDLLICDRGLMDAPVYTPGGTELLQSEFGISPVAGLLRYVAVIHLESLATAKPELFSAAGNQTRYETLEEARGVEFKTREAWREHPAWHFIGGNDLPGKCQEAVDAIIERLPENYIPPLSPQCS